MLPSSLSLFTLYADFVFCSGPCLLWTLSDAFISPSLLYLFSCGVPAALLTNLFFFFLPLLLSLSVCFLIPPS